jgi:hypothetical protein
MGVVLDRLACRDVFLPQLSAAPAEKLLEVLAAQWEDYKIYVEWLRRVFVGIDQLDKEGRLAVAIMMNEKDPAWRYRSVTSIGMDCFYTYITESRFKQVKEQVLTAFTDDRDGLAVDRSLVRVITEMMVLIGGSQVPTFDLLKDREHAIQTSQEESGLSSNLFFLDMWEAPIREQAQDACTAASHRWFSVSDIPGFLVLLEEFLAAEKSRVDAMLRTHSWPRVRSALMEVSVQIRMADILDHRTGFRHMVENSCWSDLSRLYHLLCFIPDHVGVDRLSAMVQANIEQLGEGFLEERILRVKSKGVKGEGDDLYVQNIVQIFRTFTGLLVDQFEDNPRIRMALVNGMNKCVNADDGSVTNAPMAELLAHFIDSVLCGKKDKEEGAAAAIQDAVEVFTFLNDKDMFQDSHRNLLGSRLLQDRSTDLEKEKEFIAKIKSRQDPSFTAKFEGMLTDFSSADEFNKRFASAWRPPRGHPWEFSGKLLCQGHWPPPFPTKTVALPPVLLDATKQFAALYSKEQSSRKVEFALAEGTMTVRGFFTGDTWHDLKCDTLQGIILVRFNDTPRWTVSELASSVGMDAGDVCKLLHPLIFNPTSRVLINKTLMDDHKAGKAVVKKVEPSHVVFFNDKFAQKRKMVVVPHIQLRQTLNKGAIDIGRRHVLEAAIVRIMKTRKTMKMQQLIVEVEQQVSGCLLRTLG